jgi:glycosyltransferase involved in cell wall biosynthesis
VRIALVVHQFPPEHIGGTEVYTESLARALQQLGHEVHVWLPSKGCQRPLEPQDPDGLSVWRAVRGTRAKERALAAFWHTFRNQRLERAYRAFLADVQPDVVHIQHLQWVSARLITLTELLPCVVTLHDYWFFCPNSQLLLPDRSICSGPHGGWRCGPCGLAKLGQQAPPVLERAAGLPFAYRHWAVTAALRSASRLIAPSAWVKARYVQEGFAAERIAVIPHGLDSTRLTIALGADGNGRHEGLCFGYLGSLAWQKGLHILIAAFNALPAAASLTIYGDTGAFPDYVEQLRRMATHPGIRFAGPLDRRQLGEALGALDYLVVPSLWEETFCLVIPEANACGVPAIASDLGALRDRVRDGVTGRLFPAGDVAALVDILRDLAAHPEQRQHYRAALIPAPSMDQHAQAVVAVYQSALAGRRG